MPRLLVRDLDETLHQWLRERSARHNRSMEAEARAILKTARSVEVDDPIDRILTTMSGGGAEPAGAPDQFEHEHADFQ